MRLVKLVGLMAVCLSVVPWSRAIDRDPDAYIDFVCIVPFHADGSAWPEKALYLTNGYFSTTDILWGVHGFKVVGGYCEKPQAGWSVGSVRCYCESRLIHGPRPNTSELSAWGMFESDFSGTYTLINEWGESAEFTRLPLDGYNEISCKLWQEHTVGTQTEWEITAECHARLYIVEE